MTKPLSRPQLAFKLYQDGVAIKTIADRLNATYAEVHAMIYRVRKQREKAVAE